MQREIKFRGKRIDNGEWVEGTPVWSINNRCYMIIRAEESEQIDFLCQVEYVEVDKETVGQLTGVKDKKEIEVYEGDILTDEFSSIGVLEWQNGCFVVNFGDVEILQMSDCFDDSYQMCVIGNIHDNPELLKTE